LGLRHAPPPLQVQTASTIKAGSSSKQRLGAGELLVQDILSHQATLRKHRKLSA
jgi:hypothetical protein